MNVFKICQNRLVIGLEQPMQEQLATANIKCKQDLVKLLKNIRPISEKNYSESRPSARTLGTVKKPVHFTESSDTRRRMLEAYLDSGSSLNLIHRNSVQKNRWKTYPTKILINTINHSKFTATEAINLVLEAGEQSIEIQAIVLPDMPFDLLIVIPKKNGDYRLCVDYRKINDETLLDPFPFPRIDDIINVFGGCRFFSKLDLKDVIQFQAIYEILYTFALRLRFRILYSVALRLIFRIFYSVALRLIFRIFYSVALRLRFRILYAFALRLRFRILYYVALRLIFRIIFFFFFLFIMKFVVEP
ncbi:K02A2.6-like [Cordylochernes scorpioides]|uniref:K02A2.6-like n=1 Tax=Cordylochernes scorpioides TaxID=51811 RepID=A0ABY6LPT5_9ARAC|nr:K02A2.6-like [Cordylochernes scorpioides]